ncbi:MAG TPA: hypothetical protein PK413_19580, partial [Thermoanaerobaculia bacterium]|nr:hypothetical protein [Thermoanaerobaculia bacterium]
PALWWWPLRGRRGRPAAWGTGVVVALLGLLIVAAHRVPTGRIELEDAQVVKAGGHLFPDPWVIDRTRYRGGWVLLEGDRLEAPVVPGGRRLRLALEAQLMRRHPGPVLLELSAGETVLAELTVTTNRTWRRYELPDLAWPAVRSLRLSLKRGPGSEGGNAVLLDFVELQWQ